jgi:hypothetical protein
MNISRAQSPKRTFLYLLFIAIASVTAPVAGIAQSMGKFRPDGISGSVGMGVSSYTIKSPSSSFIMDQGVYAAAIGEKGFNFLNLYLTIGLSYMQTSGRANYSYTTLSQTYTSPDVTFKANLFQAGLGLKWKIIDGYWLRPYVEGGAVGGFYQINFDSLQNSAITPVPAATAGIKKQDSLLDFGQYVEAGLEIQFSEQFGIRAAARQVTSETKEFETLNREKIQYVGNIYYFGLLTAF